MSKTFLGEAVTTACYLINSCPSSAINFKTPVEMWIGAPAYYSVLRVFGCLDYAYIKHEKLEPRALRCIFIGYLEGIKGYKFCYMKTKGTRCSVTRNVTSVESEMRFFQKENKQITK